MQSKTPLFAFDLITRQLVPRKCEEQGDAWSTRSGPSPFRSTVARASKAVRASETWPASSRNNPAGRRRATPAAAARGAPGRGRGSFVGAGASSRRRYSFAAVADRRHRRVDSLTASSRRSQGGRRARTTASSTRPSLKRRAWHRSPQKARNDRPSSVDGAPPLRTWRQASVDSDAPMVMASPSQSQRGGRRSRPAKARSTVAQTRRPTA